MLVSVPNTHFLTYGEQRFAGLNISVALWYFIKMLFGDTFSLNLKKMQLLPFG